MADTMEEYAEENLSPESFMEFLKKHHGRVLSDLDWQEILNTPGSATEKDTFLYGLAFQIVEITDIIEMKQLQVMIELYRQTRAALHQEERDSQFIETASMTSDQLQAAFKQIELPEESYFEKLGTSKSEYSAYMNFLIDNASIIRAYHNSCQQALHRSAVESLHNLDERGVLTVPVSEAAAEAYNRLMSTPDTTTRNIEYAKNGLHLNAKQSDQMTALHQEIISHGIINDNTDDEKMISDYQEQLDREGKDEKATKIKAINNSDSLAPMRIELHELDDQRHEQRAILESNAENKDQKVNQGIRSQTTENKIRPVWTFSQENAQISSNQNKQAKASLKK